MSGQINEPVSELVEAITKNVSDETAVRPVEEPKKIKWTEKLKSKKGMMIGAVAVAAVAILVGLGIYNTPANRLDRQLDLGQKYLEEQNYEQAIVAFNQAIEIDDRCLEAYVGGIEAYVQSGNVEELPVFYEKALEAARSIEGEVLDANMSYVSSIYASADEVYDDLNKITEILEEGLTVTGENQEVKQELVENYIELAKEYETKDNYTECLTVYDRLLELDEQNSQVLEGLGNCLTEYIDALIDTKNYAEAKTLIEKYKGYPLNVDFDTYLSEITELERIEMEIVSYMNKVYELMLVEDYIALGELFYSEETESFVDLIDDRYIYFPQNEKKGTGVYKYIDINGEENICFYYGEYLGEIRTGKGTLFGNCGDCQQGICIFKGDWNDDAPNGYGEEQVSHDNGDNYAITSGMLIDGIWDGEIQRTMGHFDMPFTVVDGIPLDRKDEFLEEIPVVFTGIPENISIYAYDIVNSNIMFCDILKGYKIGTIGYGGPVEE